MFHYRHPSVKAEVPETSAFLSHTYTSVSSDLKNSFLKQKAARYTHIQEFLTHTVYCNPDMKLSSDLVKTVRFEGI